MSTNIGNGSGMEIVGHISSPICAIETDQGPGRYRCCFARTHGREPECQRRGIGSALVRRDLELCCDRGRSMVSVLGHPEYYPGSDFLRKWRKI